MRLSDLDNLKNRFWHGDLVPNKDMYHISEIMHVIDNTPIVPNEYMRGYEAAEREYKRPTGKWIFDAEHSFTIDLFKCSVCGSGGHTHFNYCPRCGADMRGEEE